MTVDLYEYPHTQDLNMDDAMVSNKEHTIELQSEQESTPAPITTTDAFAPGCVIRDRYLLEDVVGAGGFAIVFRARDLRRDAADGLDRVALKVLRPELRERMNAVTRLKREFVQTRSLTHPNVVQVFDLDAQDNTWFIVMELLEGETLAATLRRQGEHPAPLPQAPTILAACAEALACLHQHNITHGDFKPTNVFVGNDGSVRIIDLGSSAKSSLTDSNDAPDTGGSVATPAYASPQVLARTTAAPSDDIFSFACVAFEMLSGSHPFAGRSCLEMQTSDATVAAAGLPAHQVAALTRGMAWQREDRPASIKELFEALTAPEPADAALVADSEAERTGTPSINDVTMTTPENAPPPLPVFLPDAHPAHLTLPTDTATPLAAPASTNDPNLTARHASPRTKQPRATPHLPVFLPSKRLMPYALLGCVLLSLGFLLFRSSDTESLPDQIPSVTPHAELIQAAAALPTPESAATPSATTPDPDQLAQVQAPPASAVSFDTDSVTVTEQAVAAVLILKRVKGQSGPVRVRWLIREASAQAGRDFNGPTSGLAEFADLQQVRALFIPLVNDPTRSGDRTFSVELAAYSRNVAIAPTRTVHVTIRDTNQSVPVIETVTASE